MYLNAEAIESILPQRPPMRLVDFAETSDDGYKVKGGLRLTGDEFFFNGHFPGLPIMPGSSIIEAVCQLGACLLASRPELKGVYATFGGANGFAPQRFVIPGDCLDMEFTVVGSLPAQVKSGYEGQGRGVALVRGVTVAEGIVGFRLIQKEVLARLFQRFLAHRPDTTFAPVLPPLIPAAWAGTKTE